MDLSNTLKINILGLAYSAVLTASFLHIRTRKSKDWPGSKRESVSALTLKSWMRTWVSHYQTGEDKDGYSIQAELEGAIPMIWEEIEFAKMKVT